MNNTTIAEIIDRSCSGITIGFIIGCSIYVIILLIVILCACAQNWDLSRIRQGQHAMLSRIKALENPIWHIAQEGGGRCFKNEDRQGATGGSNGLEIPTMHNWHVEILQPYPDHSNYAQLKTFRVEIEGELWVLYTCK